MQNLADKLRLDIESMNNIRLKRSRLDPFKYEILVLRQYGLSFKQITNWLSKEKNITISQNGLRYMFHRVWKNQDEEH